jgi:hypothetical protein
VSELDPTKPSPEDEEGARGDAESAESAFEKIFSATTDSPRDDAPGEDPVREHASG